MRREAGTGIVWLLSCLPIALSGFDPSSSVLAIAAVPWISWAGVPWRSAARPIATSALALPPLAAALALDVGRGTPARTAVLAALAVMTMLLLLGFGALRAAAVRGKLRAFELGWFLLVPGLPALVSALELGGAPTYGLAPRWLAIAASASPLAWSFRSNAPPWPPIAVCVGLLLVSGLGLGEERDRGNERDRGEERP